MFWDWVNVTIWLSLGPIILFIGLGINERTVIFSTIYIVLIILSARKHNKRYDKFVEICGKET
jgi:hypothetical protein